jgi:hypothetical protein
MNGPPLSGEEESKRMTESGWSDERVLSTGALKEHLLIHT